jgi:hypothetical protein
MLLACNERDENLGARRREIVLFHFALCALQSEYVSRERRYFRFGGVSYVMYVGTCIAIKRRITVEAHDECMHSARGAGLPAPESERNATCIKYFPVRFFRFQALTRNLLF